MVLVFILNVLDFGIRHLFPILIVQCFHPGAERVIWWVVGCIIHHGQALFAASLVVEQEHVGFYVFLVLAKLHAKSNVTSEPTI